MTQNHPDAGDWEIVPAGATPETVPSGEPRARLFLIPGTNSRVWLRDGAAGFLLADMCATLNKSVEKIDGKVLDDWGYNLRPIAGTDTWSYHAYALAVDYNAIKHPQHAVNTFGRIQRFKIHRMLKRRYKGVIRWGGDWSLQFRDDMHFQIQAPQERVREVALSLMGTTRGQSVLMANPGLHKVIRG